MSDTKYRFVITADDNFSSVIGNAEKKMDNMNSKMEKAVATAAKFATGALLGVGTLMLKASAEFETGMSNVNTLLSGNKKHFDELKAGVLDMSRQSIKPMQELTSATYDIVSAGIAQEKQLKTLADAEKLSVAGLGTVKEATDLVTSSMNAYGQDSANAANIVFKAVQAGKTTVAELTQGFGATASTARALGVAYDEFLAITATGTSVGKKASQVWTEQKAILNALVKPTEDMSKLYEKLGVSGGKELIATSGGLYNALVKLKEATDGNDEAFAKALSSAEGLGLANQLLGSSSGFLANVMASMRNGIDTVTEAYKGQNDTITGLWQNIKNNLNAVLIDESANALPMVKTALRGVGDNMELLIDSTIALGAAIGGAYLLGKIITFENAIKATMRITQAEMLVTQTRAELMAVTTGASMAAAGVSMGKASAAASALKKSVGAIPSNVWIAIGLVGLDAALNGISMLQEKIYGATQKARDEYADTTREALVLNRALASSESETAKTALRVNQDYLDIQKKIKAAKEANANPITKVLGGQSELNKLLEQEAGIKEALVNVTKNLSAEDAARLQKQQENLDKIMNKTGSATPSIEADTTTSSGGGGSSSGDDKAKKAAEELLKKQEEIRKSLFDTSQGFSKLRLDAGDSLTALEADHKEKMGKMEESIKTLRASLLELGTAYNLQVQGIDQSAAEKAVAQEQLVADLKKQLAEAQADGNTSEISSLQERITKESAALKTFMDSAVGLEDELAEARRRASLTDFTRYMEDLQKKRDEALKDYEDRKAKIEQEIADLEAQKASEIKIYETKRDAISAINDYIKNYWSTTLDSMEQRTEKFATMAEAKLRAVQAALQAMQSYSSEASSITDAKDFVGTEAKYATGGIVTKPTHALIGEGGMNEAVVPLPNGKAIPVEMSSAVGNTTKIEVKFGNIYISKEVDSDKFFKEFESKLTRAVKLQTLGSHN